eukprot:Blabericola_migrator_1__2932@NODE_1844_length_3687_cov_343_381768_g1180_i0_p2_GENE_NODE_1844_length_3687_cov_343_381768_g1180_i0NODE_1844_length_3687_cov_343_381768_g1180_i0_p2_ORF_typecomplete_len437_score101_04ATPgrasp_2/PF08442_10/3e68Ligase_CoA/PF00549_19/4_5e03Ligase_CoA/PF00549_19/1_4e04Ligase_CoA/PF00549_19/1_1e36ATPgrasp_5/PF13549_6/5_4e10Citrate_bind/PF16114_5/6_2e07CPSase_L_D2/PF02786_17/0_014CPSase_L_D2/PF02786_17/5e02GARS_A/PF01071_19/0_027Peripla_BP_3/PF13377_6/6_7e03Peripla_BP_3/PF
MLSACQSCVTTSHSRSVWNNLPRRFLNLHEYQAKELMDRFGVATQKGYVAGNENEAIEKARQLKKEGVDTLVIKAQIFAGGRGKGHLSSGLQGGVQFTKNVQEVGDLSKKMIGHTLVTHQTGPDGMKVHKVLLTEAVDIQKELYLAIILDRAAGGAVVVACKEGGVEIEEVAERNPSAIRVEPIDILTGITEANLEAIATALIGCKDGYTHNVQKLRGQLKDLLKKMYKLFTDTDASQIEINPLAVTRDGRVLCVDAKLNFDDNAQFRQKELFAQEDTSTKDKREMAAEEYHMNFVSMDGNIGCLVNGAGLAMATMDIIQLHGGSPANFLDLGGGATKEQVLKSLELLSADPNVKTILVNIFGGITRCDTVAQGILEAAQEIGLRCPLVVRLVGNNAELARDIINSPDLQKTGIKIIYVQDFSQAAKTAVEVASQK